MHSATTHTQLSVLPTSTRQPAQAPASPASTRACCDAASRQTASIQCAGTGRCSSHQSTFLKKASVINCCAGGMPDPPNCQMRMPCHVGPIRTPHGRIDPSHIDNTMLYSLLLYTSIGSSAGQHGNKQTQPYLTTANQTYIHIPFLACHAATYIWAVPGECCRHMVAQFRCMPRERMPTVLHPSNAASDKQSRLRQSLEAPDSWPRYLHTTTACEPNHASVA